MKNDSVKNDKNLERRQMWIKGALITASSIAAAFNVKDHL